MSHNYKGLFERWEVAVATKLVNDFRKNWKCLKREPVNELLQDVLIDWLSVKDKYDERRDASIKTYMGVVVRNKLGHLVEKATSEKRKSFYEAESLNAPIKDDSDLILENCLSSDTLPRSKHKFSIKLDIVETIRILTPIQQELCRLLREEGLNIKQASEKLGLPRGTVYEEIKRIRKVFQGAELDGYLQDF